MTMTGNYDAMDTDGLPNYPTFFGVTVTPVVQGVAFLLIGLAGAAAIVFYLLMPTQQEVETLQTEVQTKETTLQQQGANLAKIAQADQRLKAAKERQASVLQLFADKRSLDVVLLDVNRQIGDLPRSTVAVSEAEIATIREDNPELAKVLSRSPDSILDPNVAVINSFSPSGPAIPLAEPTYGPALVNRLIKQDFAVSMRGDFRQVVEMLRRLESQRLVLNVSNFNMAPQGTNVIRVQRGEPIQQVNTSKLAVSFTLQAVVPTPEVLGQAPPAAPAKPAPTP